MNLLTPQWSIGHNEINLALRNLNLNLTFWHELLAIINFM